MELLQCPCCDYFTLEERRAWDICPVCYWEDDGHDLGDLDKPSGCNHGLTLRQGRASRRWSSTCAPPRNGISTSTPPGDETYINQRPHPFVSSVMVLSIL